MEETEKQQHLRPKIRNTSASRAQHDAAKSGDVDKLLENTRQRIQSRLAVSSNDSRSIRETEKRSQSESGQQATVVSSRASPVASIPPTEHIQPKSILKTPKYSLKEVAIESESMDESDALENKKHGGEKPRAAVKDVVMEREPIPERYPFEAESLSVEGYTPTISNKPNDSSMSKDPVVFSSISELMEKAGTLPADGASPQVVEADLSFACMTSEEYDETVRRAESLETNGLDPNIVSDGVGKENVFVGHDDVFSEDDSEWSDNEDDPMFDGGSDASEGELPPPEPRAFIKLWGAITNWTTPETIALLKQWRDSDTHESDLADWAPQVDQTDIGSSRRKGLKAMMNMHLSSSMEELCLPQENRRQVERRLDNFLRTLDYSSPTPKCDSKLWRAMTCVLIDMILVDSSTESERHITLPTSVKEAGIVLEEFKYLTRSAVTSLF